MPWDRRPPIAKAHRLVHFLHVHLELEGMSRAQLAKASGIAERTLADWWVKGAVPNVMNIDACLGVFGFSLKVSRSEH